MPIADEPALWGLPSDDIRARIEDLEHAVKPPPDPMDEVVHRAWLLFDAVRPAVVQRDQPVRVICGHIARLLQRPVDLGSGPHPPAADALLPFFRDFAAAMRKRLEDTPP
jgi:hypothetical protein